MLGFKFGENHSDDFKIVMKSINRPILGNMIPRENESYGRDGFTDYENNRVSKRIISVYCTFEASSINDLRNSIRNVSKWLYSKNAEKLIFDDEPDKYYLARIYNQIDLESFTRYGIFKIVFECQPWAFNLLSSQNLDITWEEATMTWAEATFTWEGSAAYKFYNITSAQDLEFNNVGTKETDFNSSPGAISRITVTGSAEPLILTLNDKTITYNNLEAFTLEIDNLKQTIEILGSNQLHNASGDLETFFTIKPGNNVLNVSGANLNITLITVDFLPEYY